MHEYGIAPVLKLAHTSDVRTNVNIADDVRDFVAVYANAKGITLGDAITELIRKAQSAEAVEAETPKFARSSTGFPIFPRSGRTITTEIVKKAEKYDLE